MRAILKHLIFSYLALFLVAAHFSGLSFELDGSSVFTAVALGLGLINLFLIPVFKITSLPTEGFLSIIFKFIINLIAFNLLDRFFPGFVLTDGALSNLKLLVIVINSVSFSAFWSQVVVALLFTLVLNFFLWLSGSKK